MIKRILIIGSGGREHAIGWKLKQSKQNPELFFAPGNSGTAGIGTNINIKVDDRKKLLSFAKKNDIDLTIVGPEAPLALGIVDFFTKHGLKIFGPTEKAALLESSKVWSARFMKKYHIPSPKFHVFSDFSKALRYINSNSWSNIVIKADGLTLGKGVLVPESVKEAIDGVKSIMQEKKFGVAGKKIVIQEKLEGQEVSVIGFSDGNNISPLSPAQDHKRIFDGDKGSNTGGVGAYAPVLSVTKNLMKKIYQTVLLPTILGMKNEGREYKGVLYAGLMITKKGPKVLEFNARFGDPETQPQLMLLKSDLLKIIKDCVNGNLGEKKITFHNGVAACVILTAKGYPGSYKKEEKIFGLDKTYGKNLQIFHSGTVIKNGSTVTNGGRVLGVTALGPNLKLALDKVYHTIGKKGVYFKDMHYRKDIGRRAYVQ